jgi:hypothetical protein
LGLNEKKSRIELCGIMSLYKNRSKGLLDSPNQGFVPIDFQISISFNIDYRSNRKAFTGKIDIVIHFLPYLAVFKDKPGIGYPAGEFIDNAAFK